MVWEEVNYRDQMEEVHRMARYFPRQQDSVHRVEGCGGKPDHLPAGPRHMSPHEIRDRSHQKQGLHAGRR